MKNDEPNQTPRSDQAVKSQICFKLDRERHKALRLYCFENDIHIGDFFDELLKKVGF